MEHHFALSFPKQDPENYRVPQESILGHLYLLYINVIPQALSNTHTYLSADDTGVSCQHKDVTESENVFNKEFANVCNCFVEKTINSFW